MKGFSTSKVEYRVIMKFLIKQNRKDVRCQDSYPEKKHDNKKYNLFKPDRESLENDHPHPGCPIVVTTRESMEKVQNLIFDIARLKNK